MTVRYSDGLWDLMFSGGSVPAYTPATSGTLVVGKKYRIHTFVAGDSFTNVGAGSNATGVDFVATGTTPTTWTNSSVLTPIYTTGGIKGALQLGFINIYSGPQPLSANTAATGTLLGTVTLAGDGVTGLTFGAPASAVLSKAAAEEWKFIGLAGGTAGWLRFYPAGGNPALTSTSEARIDMAIATSGADANLSNISVTVDAPNTIDSFGITKP